MNKQSSIEARLEEWCVRYLWTRKWYLTILCLFGRHLPTRPPLLFLHPKFCPFLIFLSSFVLAIICGSSHLTSHVITGEPQGHFLPELTSRPVSKCTQPLDWYASPLFLHWWKIISGIHNMPLPLPLSHLRSEAVTDICYLFPFPFPLLGLPSTLSVRPCSAHVLHQGKNSCNEDPCQEEQEILLWRGTGKEQEIPAPMEVEWLGGNTLQAQSGVEGTNKNYFRCGINIEISK